MNKLPSLSKKRIFLQLFAILFFFLLFFFPSNVLAATYYVSSTGNDSNPGTESQPWRTISKSSSTLQPGDTVLIKQGTYYEMLTPARSGTEGQVITYQNYGNDTVVIDAQNGTRDFSVYINGKAYLSFKGLTLNGGTSSVYWRAGFYATDGSHHLTLDSLKVQNSRFGILLYGNVTPVSNVIISNSNISNNLSHGIFLYKKVYDTTVGPNNHIAYNGYGLGSPDNPGYDFGIEIGTEYPGIQSEGPRRIQVFDNEINHNGMQGIRTWNAANVLIRRNYLHHNGASGIQLENGSENMVVEHNRSEFNARVYEYETGAWVDSTKNAIVQDNILRGNKMGLLVTDSQQVILRRNVIFENNQGAMHTINAMGINIDSGSSDIIGVHNTLFNNSTGSSSRAGLTLCAYNPPGERIVIKNSIVSETASSSDLWMGCSGNGYISDYNNYFNTRPLSIYWQGARVSWPQYLSSSGQDSHSNTNNPLFINPSSYDFSLQQNSPNKDSGDFLTRTAGSGSGNTFTVTDARYFRDGIGLTNADTIKVGSNPLVKISSVNYASNTITVDRTITWGSGDGVSYPYSGNTPDKGAYEYTTSSIPTYTPTPIATPTPTTIPTPGDISLYIPFTNNYNAGNQVSWQNASAKISWYTDGLRISYSLNDADKQASWNPSQAGCNGTGTSEASCLVWQDDAVEWMVDAKNDDGGTSDRSSPYLLSDDKQGIVNLNGALVDLSGDASGNPSFRVFDGAWKVDSYTSTSTGYLLNLFIPWSDLNITPTAGLTFGLGLAYDDKDTGSFSNHIWGNKGSSFNNASNWMQVSLLPSSATPSLIPGDADGDGDVDEEDYGIWLLNYNPATTQSGGFLIGDFNSDAKVNGVDYVIWLNNYTG